MLTEFTKQQIGQSVVRTDRLCPTQVSWGSWGYLKIWGSQVWPRMLLLGPVLGPASLTTSVCPPGGLGFLTTWRPSRVKLLRERELSGKQIALSDLVSDFTWCHFWRILFIQAAIKANPTPHPVFHGRGNGPPVGRAVAGSERECGTGIIFVAIFGKNHLPHWTPLSESHG